MRYNPFETMDRMFEQMRRDMFDLRESWGEGQSGWWGDSRFGGYHMDLNERDGEYLLTVDLPGFEKDEIDLRFEDGTLFLSAEHAVSDEHTARSRSFDERIHLPKEIVEDDVSAAYHNGVLTVHLPVVEGAVEHGVHIDIE